MQFLMVPYLYFKDFAQSSGILHQAQIAKQLAAAGHGVTVLLPRKADGWIYDVDEYFPASSGVSTYEITMQKDQHMWAGLWPEDLIKILTPSRSPLIYDAVLNMIPQIAPGMKRLLVDVGFSRYTVPVINFFDTVTVPAEHGVRGGNIPGFLPVLVGMEVLGTWAADATIVTTASEDRYLRANIKAMLSPSEARAALEKEVYVPKPLRLEAGAQRARPSPGDPFRVFMGRSFGKSHEEGGKNGEQVASVIKAISVLASAGRQVKLVLATRSHLDAWAKEQLAQLSPENLELHHNATRAEVIDLMAGCHIGIDLRDYDGLYMAALEQQSAGLVTVVKRSVWAEGEVQGCLWVDSYDHTKIALALMQAMARFDELASEARVRAVETVSKHSGKQLVSTVLAYAKAGEKWPGAASFKSILPCFEWVRDSVIEGTFDFLLSTALSRMDKPGLGRYTRTWALKMFRDLGFEDELRISPAEDTIYLRRVK